MRQLRHSGWVGVILLVAGVGRLGAAERNVGWAVLSEASTDGYYRDRVHSSAANLQAVARLPELAKSGRPRQKVLAEGLIEVIGKKQVADAAAARTRAQLKSDEKKAQFEVIVGGIAATAKDVDGLAGRMLGGKNTPPPADTGSLGDVTGLFLNAMSGLGGSATRMAQAAGEASVQRLKVREYYESKVFPAARNLETGELKSALEVEITADGANRQVWSAIRNASGKTLTNVTVVLKPKERAKELSTQYYFVRDWPAGVVIRPDPFKRRIEIPTGVPDEAPPKELSASFEVWSDQGHAKPQDAKRVGFYAHRAAFVETLVRDGARYGSAAGDELVVVEFTRVTKDGDAKVVEAKVTRQKGGGKGEPAESRFRGRWVTLRGDDEDYDAVVGLVLELPALAAATPPMPVPAAPTPPSPAASRRRAAKPRPATPKGAKEAPAAGPTLTFQWDRPVYSVELPSGEKFAVQPLPDAPAAKK